MKKNRGEVGGMKDGSMIAWFDSDRQEECGCYSKVITVYFGRTHTHTALLNVDPITMTCCLSSV